MASGDALSGLGLLHAMVGTALVAGTAVGVAGDTLQLAGNVGEGVVRAAIPGGRDDDDEDAARDRD